MKVLILAAGYGTRLYPLVTDTPKPLLPVGGMTLIDHLLVKIQGLKSMNELIVVTNARFAGKFADWAKSKQSAFPVPIRIVNDGTTSPENRLGSVGDIHFTVKTLAMIEDLFVLGGDNLFDYSLDYFVDFACPLRKSVTIGLYDIDSLESATMYGVVEMGKDSRVISFEEKPSHPRSTMISMCCYYMPSETLGSLQEYQKSSGKMDKAGDYIRWLSKEKDVRGFKFSGKWYDIGSIESYKEAQEKFK